MTAGIVVACLVCMLGQSPKTPASNTSLRAVCVLYTCAMAALVIGQASLPQAAMVASGLVSGVGTVALALRMIQAARRDLFDNLILLAGALLIATAAAWLYCLTGGAVAQTLFCVILLTGIALTVLPEKHRTPQTETQGEPARTSASLSDFLSVMGIPLLGTFIYAVFIKTGTPPPAERPVLFGLDEELLASLTGAILLLALGLLRPMWSPYSSLYRNVVPLVSTAILVPQSFPYGSATYSTMVVLIVFVTAFMAQFSLGVAFTMAGAQEQPARLAVCPLLCAYALGRLCSLGMHDYVTRCAQSGNAVYQVVMACLLAAMLVLVLYQYAKALRNTDTAALGVTGLNIMCNRRLHYRSKVLRCMTGRRTVHASKKRQTRDDARPAVGHALQAAMHPVRSWAFRLLVAAREKGRTAGTSGDSRTPLSRHVGAEQVVCVAYAVGMGALVVVGGVNTRANEAVANVEAGTQGGLHV